MFRNAPKKRTSRKNERIRQLRHEQLEDRRLLTGMISGTVFEDLNADGVQDAGEVGIPNSTVSAVLSTPLLTIDNPTPEIGAHFGRDFAVVGSQIVIGDPRDDERTGGAYVFDAITGDEITKIDNPSPDIGDVFGFNMCEADGKVVISAGWDDTDGEDTGIAYLYDLASGSPLVPEREFHHPTPTGGEWFGWEMGSLPGKVLITGIRDDLGAIQSGVVYMFDDTGGPPQIIPNPSPAEYDHFGTTIASQDNRFFVHAFLNSVAPEIGVVYMYGDDGQLQETFNNPVPERDHFGMQILPSGNHVLISAWDNAIETRSGLVHLFEIDTGELVRTFASPNPSINDDFGSSLAFVGDLIAIGAQGDGTFAENGGAVYLFDMATGQLVHTLHDPTPSPDEWFGGSMIAVDGTLWVSAPGSNEVPDNPHPGVLYAFQVPETTATGEQGNYSFTGLYADDYEISQIVPDGYLQTSPGGDGTHTVTVADGGTVDGIDFGNLAYTTRVSTDTPISLQDGKNAARPGVTTSTIDVSGLSNILDLNVTVDISHSYVGQLSARLIAPDGTPVELFGNVGGSGDNFTATTFDDDAVLPIASGTAPFTATFHPEGSLADFNGLKASGIWTLEIVDNAKGDTGTLDSWSLQIAAYEPSPNVPPVADAGGTYSGTEDLTVSLDAGNSYDLDGSIVEYTWDFGDGTMPVTRSSPTVDHTYLWGDTFAVTLTVLDDRGGTATDSATATVTEVNDLPVAEVGGPYNGTVAQAVNFDGSNSSDFDNEDGTTDNDQTLTFSWDFGDGSDPVSGETVSHTYAAADTYTVTLTVNDGVATDVQTTTVEIADEPFATTMHVSDLDGAVNDLGRFWEAVVTITVLDDSGAAVPNATVYGTWSGDTSGSESVTTDTDGQATVVSDKVLDKKDMVVFTVDDILDPSPLTYEPADNTDPDDDSDGTTIIVLQSSLASLLATDNFHATVDAESLTRSQAEAAAREALALWSTQPGIALPRDVHVQVADLPGNTLGWASGSTIVLDHNANGAGWNLDVAGSTGRVDLLTAVSHEIGHLLGYEHNSDPHDVMAATLSVDTRRLPGLESIFIQPVTVNGHSLELKTDIMSTAKSRDTVAESNFDLFLTPLVMNRVQQITSSPEAYEGRMLDDILDEETELVEEELLDLLLS